MLHPISLPCIPNLVTMRQLDFDVINFEFNLECSAVHETVLCKEGKWVLLWYIVMQKYAVQSARVLTITFHLLCIYNCNHNSRYKLLPPAGTTITYKGVRTDDCHSRQEKNSILTLGNVGSKLQEPMRDYPRSILFMWNKLNYKPILNECLYS